MHGNPILLIKMNKASSLMSIITFHRVLTQQSHQSTIQIPILFFNFPLWSVFNKFPDWHFKQETEKVIIACFHHSVQWGVMQHTWAAAAPETSDGSAKMEYSREEKASVFVTNYRLKPGNLWTDLFHLHTNFSVFSSLSKDSRDSRMSCLWRRMPVWEFNESTSYKDMTPSLLMANWEYGKTYYMLYMHDLTSLF